MNKETLTVYTDKDGTVRYYNADGQLHHQNGPAILYADGSKGYYINGKELTGAEFKAWQAQQTAK